MQIINYEPKQPFIRLIGEVDRSSAINVGDEIIWHLSIDPIVPEVPKKDFFYKGRIYAKKTEEICKEAKKTPIKFFSQAPDWERLSGEKQNFVMDTGYTKIFDVKDLPDGEYIAYVEMMQKDKIISTDSLNFVLGASKPVLTHRIKLPGDRSNSYSGQGGTARCGDFNGDGKLEIVFTSGAQHQVAYDNDGKIMWEYHDPDGALIYNSAPVRVFDINNDGKDEIVCMRGKLGKAYLCIIKGATGKIINKIEWPLINQLLHPEPGGKDYKKSDFLYRTGHAHRWVQEQSMLGAKITISNLQGNTSPQDFICQTGEQNCVTLTAFNNKLQKLWERKIENGRAGHSISVEDINGDGKDEVAVGTQMLDSGGNVIWEKDFDDFTPPWEDDHIDASRIDDIDNDGRKEVVYSSRAVFDAQTGKSKWVYPTIHGQEVNIIKLRDDIPGKQLVFCDRIYRHPDLQNLIFGVDVDVHDCHGQLLWSIKRMSMHMQREIDWNGDGKNEICIGFDLPRKPKHFNAGIFDNYGRLIAVLPRAGFGAQVNGRVSDDMISWAQWPIVFNTLEVYSNSICPKSLEVPKIKKITYNEPN